MLNKLNEYWFIGMLLFWPTRKLIKFSYKNVIFLRYPEQIYYFDSVLRLIRYIEQKKPKEDIKRALDLVYLSERLCAIAKDVYGYW